LTELEHIARSLRKVHELIREELISACENTAMEKLSKIDHDAGEDTIYAIDRISEKRLLEYFEGHISTVAPVVLIAEGIGDSGQVILPVGTPEKETRFRIIVDPIDGTRGLMYQKRSAWILTGVAPNKGNNTNLQDIEFAIQTEIPLIKQYLSDMVWAYRSKGIGAERFNRLTGKSRAISIHPSTATTIAHGFAMISRFFPGAREVLAQIDEDIVHSILGDVQPGKAHCFEDQYLSSGGQLYELMCGHDRFVADLRPLLEKILKKRGLTLGLCCHPYDLCTELIAREAGVVVTDPQRQPVHAKLNVAENVSWIGYANDTIRRQVEPHLQNTLRKYQLI
jgi:fructose-1,6-bisphosphatase/inositol monophosphatase family enzyme